MAANSGGGNGVDWNSILETLSPFSYRTISKTDLLELARAIRRSETLISNCNPEFRYFFCGLGIIAVEVFAASVLTLTSPQALEISKATDIIVGFLCQEIRREFYADPHEQILTCRRILETCQILCTLDTTNVDLEDRESLIKVLRKQRIPEDDRYLLPDVSRNLSRFDQSSHIFDQLITPQLDVLEEKVEVQDAADNKPSQNPSTPDFQPDIKTYFTQRNLFTLRSLGIGEILLDVCLSLSHISRHAGKVRDSFSKNTVPPPLVANDALGFRLSIHSIDRDMTLLNNTLKLPLVEPLIPNKLEKLALLSMTSLYLAVATSTSSTICGIAMLSMPKVPASSGSKLNEDESVTDRHAISLVEKALDLFNHVSWTLMQSATTGAPTSQNHLMMAGMVLLSGLQSQLQAASNCTVTKDDRGKSPSRKSFEKFNIMKVQHGFNVLSVAIASTLLKVLSDLMDALKVECMQQNKAPEVGPIKVDIMGNFTSFQRVMRVLQVTPIIPFFFNTITICYRKASALKREKTSTGCGGGVACASDGTSFFEDDFTCTEVVRVAKEEIAHEEETREEPTRDDCSVEDTFKDEDEDSEPILGLWLEETLAPELYITTAMDSPIKSQNSSGMLGGICSANDFKASVIPDKGQEAFISLASLIIKFINNYLINCDTLDVLVRHLQTSIGDQQIVLLCGIIKDLDRESSKSHIQDDEVLSQSAIRLDNIYNQFSRFISQFIHNLLTNKILSENFQKQLLNHLVKDHDTNTWPLQLYSRSLAVVSQIVMLKPLPERTTTTVTLWKRLINTLLDNVSFAKKSFDVDREDLNIEHVYVLLYMYHALNLIPRKSVMLMTGSALVRCSELMGCAMSDMQIIYLSRLLLLFEYQLRHLYETPPTVLEQTEWVLFVAPKIIRDSGRSCRRHTFLSAEVEASYRKSWNQQDNSLCPRFYYISSPDAVNPEIPKIDGLACKFILGSAPKWKYQLLFDALIEILNIANQLNPTTRIRSLSFVGRCAVQYAFTICWRILQMLPPSIEYLENLSKDNDRRSSAYVLHTLFWGPRTASKNFSGWIKECLIKQGAGFQVPDNLVQSVSETVKTVMYDIFVVKKCIARFAPHIKCWKDLVDESDLPKITDIIVLDLLVCKLRVTIDDRLGPDDEIICNHIEDDELRGCDLAEDLMPHFCRLLDIVIASIRSCLLSQIEKLLSEADSEYVKEIDVIWHLLFISSHKMLFNISLVQALQALIPPSVIKFMEKWNEEPMENSHIRYNNDAIPTDGYLSEILNYHISGLSCDNICSVAYSLKMLLTSIVKFIDDYVVKFPPRDLRKRTVEYLVALSLDLSTFFVSSHTVSALETLVGEFDNEDYVKPAFYTIIEHFFKLIERFKARVRHNLPITSSDHKVLFECLKFMETILEKPYANMALYNFLNKSTTVKLLDILLLYPASKGIFDPRYANMSLRVLNKLAYHEKLYDYIPTVKMYRIEMISELSQLKNVDNSVLCGWLSQLVFGSYNFTSSMTSNSGSDESKVQLAGIKSTECKNAGTEASVTEVERNLLKENISLLQSIASFMVKEESNIDENAPLAILRALIIISSKLLEPPLDGAGFVELMSVMKTLAESSSGCGYVLLFKPATEWLKTCYNYLHYWEVEVVLQREQYPVKHRAMCDAACALLSYIGGIFEALSSSSHDRQTHSSWDDEMTSDRESDLVEDLDAEDEESDEDDSDEDSLCNRLCTFTITQREFMNQHWYHCHTCKMVDGVGVCSVCARVCHRGHDVTYAKYGNFFCDCGAKEDGSCIALEKRSRLSTEDFYAQSVTSSGLEQQVINSSQQQNRSSPVNAESGAETVTNHDTHKPANLETFKGTLLSLVNDSNVIHCLDNFIRCLVPAMQGACKSFKTVGSYHRARDALHLLHLMPKKFESADQLMVPTLGSQEGAFENVRMSYSGEQGQSIRQLLSAQLIRRVAMCCMASPHGKRQHLAVSHEKGKITVLQLSALLKQPEASKRKLTLTRLSSAPIPFTVLSITGNPCNEDFLAVCGLKDCHVLTFSSSGSVVDHLVLHPQLEIGNFIIRAIWLPGSQTQLALVTADFVKIYDLSKDGLNPQYFFLIPAGKVRDCTFVSSQYLEYNSEGFDHMLLMCSNGHIYDQVMNEESSAVNGHFYVTNTLTLCHPEIGEVVGQIASQGGVSVYYSHCLQMLFWSYANGKSFLAPLRSLYNPVTDILLISIGKQSSNGNKAGNTLPQPLCQWTEVPNHPGLVCSVMQGTNNPVILMLKPMVFLVQEIKVVPAKAKIMDMVVVRHPSSNSDFRTTLILLCEDGSLRIYMAEPETTGYWLSSSVKSIAKVSKTSKKKKVAKVGKPLGSLVFPVDFFEHCEPINMVEFGGNDLLQIYSANQIKHRLNTTGLYVASAKHPGFSIEITNPEPTMMIMGIRVLLGTQEIQKAPTYVEVFGRTIATNVIRSRWYDIPFTREESLQADKKFIVTFGPSTDVEHIIMVDSIKVYCKLKDISNWNDDSDELLAAGSLSKDSAMIEQEDTGTDTPLNISCLERLTSEALAATDNFFILASSAATNIHVPPNFKSALKELVTILLTLPIQNCVQYNAECLLVTLHSSKSAYFNYKDHALLQHVYTTLHACMQGNIMSDPKNLDSEDFYQLVMTTRSVAVARPYNLAKFEKNSGFDDGQVSKPETNAKMRHFMVRLVASLWCIHSAHPVNMALAPVYVIGLTHVETTVQAIVEIIHAFTTCDPENTVPIAAQLYLELLLCEDTTISFSAKQALVRVLRPRGQVPRIVTTQPHCTIPRGTIEQEQGPQSQESTDEQPTDCDSSDPSAAAVNEPSFSASSSSISDGSVETLLNATGNFPALMDIAPDTDDETLVELAIALSLQGMDPSLAQGTSQEGGHYSDTTASAGGSDDEGSTAATDGSTLRTSPAEQMQDTEENENEQKAEQEHDTDTDVEEEPSSPKLHLIRLTLLEHLVQAIPKLKEVGGVNAIPFMQVILLLTTDLYCNEERSQRCLQSLLSSVLTDLNLKQINTFNIAQRSKKKEVHLVFMRLLSVMLFRTKSSTKASSENMAFISSSTAAALQEYDLINYCLTLLKALLMYWKSSSPEEGGAVSSGSLLKAHPTNPPPDMSPFFLRLYVKSHAADVFEAYPQLLTEMVVRLPYQVHKNVQGHTHPSFTVDMGWRHFLCEYMMIQQTPFVRRQVRKLLLSICSSKDEYRQLRDIHSLNVHISRIQRCYHTYRLSPRGTNIHKSLPYDRLVELMEHLKACVEIATSRVGHWQTFCTWDKQMVPFLVKACLLLDEGVAPTFLQLLQCLVCDKEILQNASANNIVKQPISQTSTQPSTSTAVVEKEKHDVSVPESGFQESFCGGFVNSIFTGVSKDFLTGFIKTFLLDTNATAVRWQTHALLLGIFKYSLNGEYESLLEIMWSLWPQLPAFGRKAAQYVDLLGYFSLNVEDTHRELPNYVEEAVNLLQTQNKLLACHPNSNLYTHVAQYVELDGFYLESEPCLVCNNPEVPFTSVKLSTIKIDSKFTTHTQIVKLIGSHTISRITLRISELKRTKMVRTLNIYYNNRTVQAVVELKNKPAMWNKAKKVTLTSGQTETKIDFPLPIVACNLMIEYADFYENIQASSETLQCPRCSASVPANPGVCTNCGENVFQCHKCRAINYDEKDPFLCHACGFCKYAKFDYSLTARSCCAVDKIENDEDRKKTISIINSLLEKADRVYKTISTNKPTLELLLLKICEHRLDRTVEDNVQVGNVGTTQVNRAIQLLAQRYCGECKNSFEELSKIIQRVLACRRELVMYDQCEQVYGESSAEAQLEMEISVKLHQSPFISNCYGCASSATELCLTLLRALASHDESRQILISQGLIAELLDNNLKRGTSQVQEEVRQLLCLLTRDNNCATEDLRQLLMERIGLALRGHKTSAELTFAVRHEMSLLSTLVMKDDACWEQKLRCVMHLFMMACDDSHSPVVMQSIILPCLKMLQSLIKPDQPVSKKNKDKSLDALANISPREGISMVLIKYLQGDSKYSYNVWYSGMPSKLPDPTSITLNKQEWREMYLIEKYGERWCQRVLKRPEPLHLSEAAWLKNVLFNPCSRLARQVACNMLESLCQVSVRKRTVVDLLTGYLCELSGAGESAAEYLSLYQSLIQQSPWKEYLALRGILVHIASLITQEIEELHRLEATTLTSNLSQGYALKMLTELLSSFLEQDCIKQQYKGRLVGAVLNGYVSIRRLVIQRTRLIDETQDKLLEILEEITTGTEEETRAFMTICIEAVKRYSSSDMRTPVFIFERICSIIYPEDNDTGEFFLTLEKDPQQEDFLQGRMVGNPYVSSEQGLGPLMRDVKNKICQDCELVALLEDDNGMELLVNNKIISLDLPVREVYKKIWVAEGGEGDAMRVVYRMRGLLGDATEEFVETLVAKNEQETNDEEVYKMANVMADCGGLQIMLDRFAAIKETTKSKPLLQVLLKLFKLCLKVKRNQELLTNPDLGTICVLLRVLHLTLRNGCEKNIAEQLLQIMEAILLKAASQPVDDFIKFSASFGGTLHINILLPFTSSPVVICNSSLLLHLTHVLAALTYCNDERMALLCNHFKYVTDFNKFDVGHTSEDEQKLELFCILTTGIERNPIGNTLKDHIINLGIVKRALDYIMMHAPCDKPILVRSDCEKWKDFISKPALKYILRFLTGLAANHPPTQVAVSTKCVPIIHQLEQMSSDEHVGSLAENLLEALRQHPQVATHIEEVREHTRAEKKKLAMAMREKQLGALGMCSNEKGQVTAKSPHMMEDLGEETGLICVICREGYKFQPNKVLGIYTFSKRCNVEEFEVKHRKTLGYTTVTHFNIVHIDCHMSAVRLARSRDEWESAALQNANTRCNGLLPLWGPLVPESAYASCLARHNTYLYESTGHRDINCTSAVHDLKLLLLRFAQEKSFHEDTGGGGPQSNMLLVPYLLHMALYVLNSTRIWSREEECLNSYLSTSHGWVQDCYVAEGPLYWCVMSLLLHSPARWMGDKLCHLNRILLLAQAHEVQPTGPGTDDRLVDSQVKSFSVYKSYLIFFGLIDQIYKQLFRNCCTSLEKLWPSAVADYIRHNDETIIKACDKLFHFYTEDLLPCASFDEIFDVLGLRSFIEQEPNTYIQLVLSYGS